MAKLNRTMADDTTMQGGGMPPLQGYLYQVDISILAALDTLIVKKMTDRLILEPVGQEDLEADLKSPLAASAATDLDSADYRLVVQAKFRSTGLWKSANFAELLQHGTKRPSALKRLENDRTRYLLITTAPTDTPIQELLVKNIGEWPRKTPSSAKVAGLLPNGAHRRVAILQWSEEIVRYKLNEYLESNFRVPRPNVANCISQLRAEALDRMRGGRGGVWTRRELQELIRQHQGYFASATEIELYVRPGNWSDLIKQLKERYAVVIVGQSGTGKSTTALVVADLLQMKYPGLTIKHIVNGPWEISTDNPTGPIAYLIDDPWGKYLVGPNSEPWNDEIQRFFSSASASRYFIVTSRSDVFASSRTKLNQNWFFELEPDNYTPELRLRILEKRLQKMPRRLQDLAYQHKWFVAQQLTLPLEIAKYVEFLAGGPRPDERPEDFLHRALYSAKNETIEGIVAQQVTQQDAYPWAAAVWGVFKASPNVERSVFSDLQSRFADLDRNFDDGLERFVTFLENGRSLRQNERLLSYYHPRVEAGLQAAILEKSTRSRRILGMLADALIAIYKDRGTDWGADACAAMLRAARELKELADVKPHPDTIAALDDFLIQKLQKSDKNFIGVLRLAANAMSAGNEIAVLCRWLTARRSGARDWGLMPTWECRTIEESVHHRLARNPDVVPILRKFVRHGLPHDSDVYPDDMYMHLQKLDPEIANAFVAAARDSIGAGYYWHADAVAAGAAQALDAFWPVVQESIKYLQRIADQPNDGTNLAIHNREYSDDYAEHLADSASEEGYSADAYIRAYVAAFRRKYGWEPLSQHPQISEMGGAWLKAAREDDVTKLDEVIQLAVLARDAAWEDDYWYFAEKRWISNLDAVLLARVESDSVDHRLRQILLKTGLRCIKDSVHRMVDIIADGGESRILTALDDVRHLDDSDLVESVKTLSQSLLSVATPAVQELIPAISAIDKSAPLSFQARTLLGRVSRPNYPSWQLRRAQLLAASEIDVSGLIDDLLTAEENSLSETIPAASGAVQLAAELGLDAVVDSALSHRYADVRTAAMKLVAQRSTGDLPPEIMALADDKGSGVKTTLLELIEMRPGQYAIDALTTLAQDQWSSASRYYGEGAHFDIAQKAADLLATTGNLSENHCSALMKGAETTDDQSLAQKLYYAIAKGGGAAGEKMVLDFGLTRGRVRPKAAALLALADLDKVGATDMLARADGKEITERAARPAALLAYLVGSQAEKVHALAVANEISVHPQRAAMLFPLFIGANDRGGELPALIEALFPAEIMDKIRKAGATNGILARNILNPIGDPETLDGIISAFPHCFEKPKK